MLYRVAIAAVAVILAVAALSSPVGAHQPAIGKGSCNGERACEGLTGTAGDNSCNGTEACLNSSPNALKFVLLVPRSVTSKAS